MGRRKNEPAPLVQSEFNKRMTPEARDSQMTALAYDLVEQRLRNGTATSQETTYFLKLGSGMNKLEKRELESKIKLLEAKVESMESARRTEELYRQAFEAVQSYKAPVTMGGYDRHD